MRAKEYNEHRIVAGMSIRNGVSMAGSWSGELFLIHAMALAIRRRGPLDFRVGITRSVFSIGGS